MTPGPAHRAPPVGAHCFSFVSFSLRTIFISFGFHFVDGPRFVAAVERTVRLLRLFCFTFFFFFYLFFVCLFVLFCFVLFCFFAFCGRLRGFPVTAPGSGVGFIIMWSMCVCVCVCVGFLFFFFLFIYF